MPYIKKARSATKNPQKSSSTSESVQTTLLSSIRVRPMSSLGQHFSQISILEVLPHPAANP